MPEPAGAGRGWTMLQEPGTPARGSRGREAVTVHMLRCLFKSLLSCPLFREVYPDLRLFKIAVLAAIQEMDRYRLLGVTLVLPSNHEPLSGLVND